MDVLAFECIEHQCQETADSRLDVGGLTQPQEDDLRDKAGLHQLAQCTVMLLARLPGFRRLHIH